MNAKAAAAAEVAKRDADLRAQYVVVPPGEEAKPVSCPICKEHFKSEFLEDDEDWVWRNAVLKDERVRPFFVLLYIPSSFVSFAGLPRNLSRGSCEWARPSITK